MNRVFVDTAAWLALLSADDEWHQKARIVRLDLVRTGCILSRLILCCWKLPMRYLHQSIESARLIF